MAGTQHWVAEVLGENRESSPEHAAQDLSNE